MESQEIVPKIMEKKYVYDQRNRLIQEVYEDKVIQYEYDAVGNIKKQTLIK